MKVRINKISVLFTTLLVVLGVSFNALAAGKVRIALGDVASVETLCFLVALDRAKDRGLDYEMTAFAKEQLAIQAVMGNQMDIAVGTPYAIIQKSKVPIRNFFQLSKLVFFPVADKKYKTWQDLDGEPFTFHARGTGTEAIGDIIIKREGITLGQRSYVPGSENRIIGMMNGQINATIVDLSNKNILMAKAGDKFHVLPGISDPASDEVLFADLDWLKENEESVAILVEELLRTWQEMTKDPSIIEKERAARNLLSDLPKELLAEVDAYYVEAVEGGLYDPMGGGVEAAKADFAFYVDAGQMEGPAADLKVEDYWYLEPLDAAKAKLGLK
ncbi:MAG: ABC transporter substrate-binding protein [Desulfuromonadales bacterium]|jgi:NitT/TauT family transport system substrate-binding protein|nr:ABC transporter substrate-binding protein [Desulfuromonadales bacterium]